MQNKETFDKYLLLSNLLLLFYNPLEKVLVTSW